MQSLLQQSIDQTRRVKKSETEITVETDKEDQTIFVKDNQDFSMVGSDR